MHAMAHYVPPLYHYSCIEEDRGEGVNRVVELDDTVGKQELNNSFTPHHRSW